MDNFETYNFMQNCYHFKHKFTSVFTFDNFL